MPFNGQTTSNHTKLGMPSRSPLDFGVHMPVDMSNGSSRRVASGHQILPALSVLYHPGRLGHFVDAFSVHKPEVPGHRLALPLPSGGRRGFGRKTGDWITGQPGSWE
jgi:hypothetical protein